MSGAGGGGSAAVLFGPRTRLAAEVLALDADGRRRWHLLCRTSEEREWAVARFPTASCLEMGDPLILGRPGRLLVLCCALGPIHPAECDPHRASAGALRDLGAVDRLLGLGLPTRVIFVSSVLAMLPSTGRFSYAGWKTLLEGTLRQAVDRRGASLSVLYPGRLIVQRPTTPSLQWLHTTYRGMARRVLREAAFPAERRLLVGADARLLAAQRCGRGMLAALFGGRR